MPDQTTLANRYLSVWNERNADRRRPMLAELFTAGVTYVDPLMRGTGHDQIDCLIAAVQQRFPEFRFELEGRVDGHADYMRFSWGLGPAGADAVIKGTDVAHLQDGRFATVIGFLDQVPPGA
jgi:hypothetical protein